MVNVATAFEEKTPVEKFCEYEARSPRTVDVTAVERERRAKVNKDYNGILHTTATILIKENYLK